MKVTHKPAECFLQAGADAERLLVMAALEVAGEGLRN